MKTGWLPRTEYEKLFGRSVDGMEIEATVWSVNAYTEQAAAHRLAEAGTLTPVKAAASRMVFDPPPHNSMRQALSPETGCRQAVSRMALW